jgi:hypothetical protein
MKNNNLLFLLFCFFFISISGYAQKAKIETNEKSVITVISAVGNDEIFTEIGNLKFSEIKEVLFETYDPKYSSVYTKIQTKVPVKFGDGTDLGETRKESISMDVKDLSTYSNSYPEDQLINASKSALTGMGLTVLGGILVIVGAGTDGGELSIAGGVASLVGFGFIGDAWSKIGKAGKAMKAERVKKNKEK